MNASGGENQRDGITADLTRPQAWLSTTAGIVLMLLVVQFATGLLLAFYYVPSVDHAYTTVAYMERSSSSGSWIRSLHHFGSQLLPLFLFLHVIRLFSCEAYKHWKIRWLAAILLLALVMAAGGTGYSLPWDARAFFSTRVAEGLVGGLPLLGRLSRLWLLGGDDISTVTLSRFFALHVLVTPFLILLVVGWRLAKIGPIQRAGNTHVATNDLIQQLIDVGHVSEDEAKSPMFRSVIDRASRGAHNQKDEGPEQPSRYSVVLRNCIAAGIVFIVLAIWAARFPAPLGPSVSEVTADYLPRPGAQFLWLYQSLKYVPGGLGSIVGVVIPGLAILILLTLPWLNLSSLKKYTKEPQRLIAGVILAGFLLWVLAMTTASYLSDRRDPRIRAQLAKQSAQEETVRTSPFRPVSIKAGADSTAQSQTDNAPPTAYLRLCVSCHGPHGEGATQGTLRFPPLIGVSNKPGRTVSDIIALLNDPRSYGIEPPMRSFATKLSEDEKSQIAEWIVRLK